MANYLIIDPSHNKNLSPFLEFLSSNFIDYNTLTRDNYDAVFIECDTCKLNDDIAWSHWVRKDEKGFPMTQLTDEFLFKQTWGSSEKYSNQYRIIFEAIKKINIKKIVIVDLNDRPYVSSGLKWLEKNNYKVDHILKREYRRTHLWDYTEKVHPFPFMTFDSKASIIPYKQIETCPIPLSERKGCFFIGSPLLRMECGMRDEWVNRYDFLKVMERLNCIHWYKENVSHDEYLKLFHKHRSYIHLNGTGHLCNRFFEGIGKDSLCIMQENDIIFVSNETMVHPSLIFEVPEQAKEIVNKLDNDDSYYNECMEYQRYMLKKWFNRESVKLYIDSILKDKS